jgi:hypothetical protein
VRVRQANESNGESVHTTDRCLIASIAIRIVSDTRDEEQEQRWRER